MLKSDPFTVDASLLRELGEKLIGRAHIALAELVKNSYDADAANCRIEFGDNQIVISDDGTGISESEFHKYWMRIGTTHKVKEGASKAGRPLAGSKGVGRLSVQFLADEMTLESNSEKEPKKGLYAIVDWTHAVSGADLRTVEVAWEIRSGGPTYPNGHTSGTRITLKRLKKNPWDSQALEDLGREVWMLRSPFRRFAKRVEGQRPEDFDIEIEAPGIEGARDAFDKDVQTLFSNWKARIRGTLDRGCSGGKGTISVEFKPDYPKGTDDSARFREIVTLPIRRKSSGARALIDEAKFEILIFKPEGKQPGGIAVGDLREYLAEFGNVSVYDAGFRLPYYGSGRDAAGQDWLSIALDQGRRLNASDLLPEHLRTQNKYMQDLPAPGRIFGAVEIDTNHERAVAEKSKALPGEWLQIQSGRDRLHDNDAFSQLRDFVRFSLDFYANRFRLLAIQALEEVQEKEPSSQKFERAIEVLERNKAGIPPVAFREIRRVVVEARKAATIEEQTVDRRAALFAPLATAGMVALALNHELSREVRYLDHVGGQLRRLASAHSIPELTGIADQFDEAKRRLESLQELFAPLLSDTDKEATERLKVRAVVEQVADAMDLLMPHVQFSGVYAIPSDLRFPIGSFSEWNALLQNVLTNAWNAMLDSGKAQIGFRGGSDSRGREWLRVSDTGKGIGVPLSDTQKLFEPFERRLEISDDKRSIALGGQGLGLAIVRMIARRRSADVRFVQPEPGFSTTFEISWRGGKR